MMKLLVSTKLTVFKILLIQMNELIYYYVQYYIFSCLKNNLHIFLSMDWNSSCSENRLNKKVKPCLNNLLLHMKESISSAKVSIAIVHHNDLL